MSSLRILLLEDDPSDAELVQATLEADQLVCDVNIVKTRAEFLTSLESQQIDLVLADYKLPSFGGLSALKLLLSIRPDLPFIFVSGTFGEESAIEALKIGATDYVLKTRLSKLVPAVRRALREKVERQRLIELEDALRQIQKMETLGQLTGGIAHDFKNMLMLITGNLEIIEDAVPRDDDNTIRRALERARVGADRAAALTQRLLAFSRQQTLDPKPVQINELISPMADIWRQALGDAIRLDIDVPQRSPTIFVDPNQLENAVLNLILNARDASNPGARIKVVSEVMFVDTPTLGRTGEMSVGEYASISVEDQGSGIPNELLDRIFEPLFTTKPVGQGTGLGLSLVYGFVKQSKGHIDITSALGRGTTVRLIFPSFRQPTVD
jgi:two-component system, cell cycle sensor histidine kinase and response regulator CckA